VCAAAFIERMRKVTVVGGRFCSDQWMAWASRDWWNGESTQSSSSSPGRWNDLLTASATEVHAVEVDWRKAVLASIEMCAAENRFLLRFFLLMVGNRCCLDTRDIRENLLGDRGEEDLIFVDDRRWEEDDDDVEKEKMDSLMLRLRPRPRRVSRRCLEPDASSFREISREEKDFVDVARESL
jgi:hypothetical protein